jgi:predicted protein tyrosine phosphatase
MSTMNRLHNVKNPNQGEFKKVLCLCSAGLLRSPTAAFVLSQEPFNYNTRAAGVNDEYALIPLDDALLAWADEIVVMEKWQFDVISAKTEKPVLMLGIPDRFRYRDPELIDLIKKNYETALKFYNELPEE